MPTYEIVYTIASEQITVLDAEDADEARTFAAEDFYNDILPYWEGANPTLIDISVTEVPDAAV